MYIIQVKEKYGNAPKWLPETNYTKGNNFDREDARRLKNLLQKYSSSLYYRIKEVK